MTVPTMDEIDKILAEVEQKRQQYTTVTEAVHDDESIDVDDVMIEICRWLDIEINPPVIHNDGMGTSWCDYCGVEVLGRDEKHQRWHERVMAATKLALWLAELSFKHTALLGLTLSLTLQVVVGEDEEPDPHE